MQSYMTTAQVATIFRVDIPTVGRDIRSEEMVAKRCARCELVFAETPENFAVDQENRDGPGSWCRQCATESRLQSSENKRRSYQNV